MTTTTEATAEPKKKRGRPKGSTTPPTPPRPWPLTAGMREAVQPFLPKLLKRYREVAERGSTELPDPVCKKTERGACYACVVWGCSQVKTDNYAAYCENYLPVRPPCVDDRDDRVEGGGAKRTAKQKKAGTASGLEQTKQWGREVVAVMEGWRGVEDELEEADL